MESREIYLLAELAVLPEFLDDVISLRRRVQAIPEIESQR
jgi:hypothetical protein